MKSGMLQDSEKRQAQRTLVVVVSSRQNEDLYWGIISLARAPRQDCIQKGDAAQVPNGQAEPETHETKPGKKNQ